jgi:carbohydrate kinase (thermoresistant glucokinase family)
MQSRKNVVFVIGVSGSGKTTIGKLLAETAGYSFYDGDDFHPAGNIQKMKSGVPLNDDDRYEWLIKINEFVRENSKNDNLVIACSALKEKYRLLFSQDIEAEVNRIVLNSSAEIISARMQKRQDHFMPA